MLLRGNDKATQIARTLLAKGMAAEEVAAVTGLSPEEVVGLGSR